MADPATYLTKRVEFSAAHFYHRPEWSEEENRRVFGACADPDGHGHNYLLDVTVAGAVDPRTGMVVNLNEVKRVIGEVVERFDHKHLNLDLPWFRDRVPTTENLARVLWEQLAPRVPAGRLSRIRLYEDEDLFVDYYGGEDGAGECEGRAASDRRPPTGDR